MRLLLVDEDIEAARARAVELRRSGVDAVGQASRVEATTALYV